ncbi:MAG: hypothetical protein JSS82_12460 [Bacteroidetes bacterium]|nr:hypothetical protein [Bacteroidota bacterium]
MWDGGVSRLIVLPTRDRITEVLDNFAILHPAILADSKLQATVVIEGFDCAQLYSAETFRWLCGVAADPSGKDPNWMG